MTRFELVEELQNKGKKVIIIIYNYIHYRIHCRVFMSHKVEWGIPK